MKICIVGAGAIGGYLGVRLALTGHDVTLIARGPHLAAIQAHGLKLILDDASEQVASSVHATDRIEEAGMHDAVILGMKAHAVAPVAPQLKSLCGSNTLVVTTQNGIPWWYFHKNPGLRGELAEKLKDHRLESVDPGGVIEANIDIDRVIGCVVYPACEIAAPGVIRHIEGNRFSLAEIDGGESERVKTLAQAFRDAGFKSPILSDIRSEIWLKLWGNLSFNPISALTHATLVDICQFAPTRNLAANMMREAQQIGEKLGIQFKVSLERRIAGAEAVGKHKTSMLQDVEAGRALEIEALVGSVAELGRLTDTPTPNIDAIYAVTSLLAKTLQAANARLQIPATSA
jgi:2-dehydropantoate 2-reductase